MNKIKLLIVDDHQVVRKGIINLLEDEEDILIVGEAENGFEALEKIKILHPDVVLLDISMPKLSGLETAALIEKNHKNARTIMFSMHNNEDYIVKSVEAGAHGYILKDTTHEELLEAIRTVFNGEKYFNSQISTMIVNGLANRSKNSSSKHLDIKITKSEKVILNHIVNGLNSREIAEKMNLSIRTIDNHRAHIMKKTNVKNAVELVKLAIKDNLST